MPAELWDAAVASAKRFGVCAVARGTGIGYKSLRQRFARTGASVEASARFVELEPMLPLGEWVGVSPCGAVVELRDGRGAQVTVRLGPGSREAVDVSAIVASLWGREGGSRGA
jgi:hypothetical protein